MDTIGRRILHIRNLLDLTQEGFAALLRSHAGVKSLSRGAVGNWEQGEGIKVENIKIIADMTNVTVDWLMLRRGPDPTKDDVSINRPIHESTSRPQAAKAELSLEERLLKILATIDHSRREEFLGAVQAMARAPIFNKSSSEPLAKGKSRPNRRSGSRSSSLNGGVEW